MSLRELGIPTQAQVQLGDGLRWGLWSGLALALGLLVLPFAGLFVAAATAQKLVPQCAASPC